jgi:ribonuclease J
MVKIHTVGGFSEVGKNMVVVEDGEDAFVFDEGFYLPAIVEMAEKDRDEFTYSESNMRKIQAIPDDRVVEKIRHKVRAQFIGHAHLDHVGAVPFMSDRYNAPIYGTPFTCAVLDSLLKDNDIFLKNKVNKVEPNTTIYIPGKSRKYRVDFINITHSTIQTAIVALHTSKGVVLYMNDFKLDNTPVVGLKPNYDMLKEVSKEGVLTVIIDSLYSGADKKTPSEKIARHLLEEVLFTIDNKHSAIFVTTFSSHIARLKSIVEYGKKLNREVVFLGRSLSKYSFAAQDARQAPFLKNIPMMRYRRQLEKFLHKVEKDRKKYLVVCTGHQGEPGSILERISRNKLPFKFSREDNIVFSSSVIPTPTNQESFAKMETRLKKKNLRLFRDVHVSGHGGREDLRDILKILNPKHIIPSHGGSDKTTPMVSLASELGYKKNKNVHLMQDGKYLKL